MPASTLTIRPALPAEAERLTAIALAAKRHWGYPAAWIADWLAELTVTADYVRSHHVLVAENAETVIGFAAVEVVADEACLQHLWVTPEWIGRGAGRALFDAAIEVARSSGARALEWESDPHADGFYQHMGAQAVTSRRADRDGVARTLTRFRFPLVP